MAHFPSLAGPTLPPPAFTYAGRMCKPGDPTTRHRCEQRELTLKVRGWLSKQISAATRDSAPRMLWVQGRPNEGKSQGCLLAALNAGFHVLPLTGGDFAGKTEGASIEALREVLQECVTYSAMMNARVVIMLDDFDLSTANIADGVAGTINGPLLVQEMMALADQRQRYRNADGSNLGFIVTVNDASGMRESLTRMGRAEWHDHCPSAEDRANVAWAILAPQTTAERDLVHALVRKHIKQPIGFWQALRDRMRSLETRHLIEGGMPSAAALDAAYSRRLRLRPAIAWQAAKELRTTRVRNWLAKKTWLGL